ncbi:YoaK family protein [Streptomyces sp. NPDC048196]|uniref:YoaK family protein n=1 Tax=Streptomyces sp. NPDC048196 TaxID=3154712 RepID=UPI0033C561E4
MEPPSGIALTVVMVCLTVATGVVDAITFLTLGQVFAAMQTGNLLFLGFGVAGQGGLPVLATAVSLGAFALGAALGARWESGLAAREQQWFPAGLFTEAALLAGAAAVAWGMDPAPGLPPGRRYAVIGLLALAMGMRNVTAMRSAPPDLTTTVATRTMAALVSGSVLGHDKQPGHGGRTAVRRLLSVGAMFAGGLLGAVLLGLGTRPALVILLVAAFLAGTAAVVPALVRREHHGQG